MQDRLQDFCMRNDRIQITFLISFIVRDNGSLVLSLGKNKSSIKSIEV